MAQSFDLDAAIRKVPDFPKKGILFYDITGILMDTDAFRYCIDTMKEKYKDRNIHAVAAIEARGFLFAAPFALEMEIPLILIRKKGKLPRKTISATYALEYGEAEIEMHADDVQNGWNVLIVDDLFATGGTVKAACGLIEQAGGHVKNIFGIVGLPFLDYEKVLEGYTVETLINYHSEQPC